MLNNFLVLGLGPASHSFTITVSFPPSPLFLSTRSRWDVTHKTEIKRYGNLSQVLRFHMYFKEAVQEREDETFCVRKCDLMYYLEDQSVSITEAAIGNSGLAQGVFLNRAPLRKANMDLYTPQDFRVGETITINSRSFHIVDCDRFTRDYMMTALGVSVPPGTPFPRDPHMDAYYESKTYHASPCHIMTQRHTTPRHAIL